MKSKILKIIIAVLITIILLLLLLTQINLGDIISTLTKINPLYILICFSLYVCSYFFRAWRFHILLNKQVGVRDLFHIGCVHNMINSLLPARTGEISYIYLLKSHNKRTTGEGIATLVVSRIFDFIALALFFFISVILMEKIPDIISQFLWISALFAILLLVFFVIILYSGRKFGVLIQKIAITFHVEKSRVAQYLLHKIMETAESLETIRIGTNLPLLFISSIIIWGANFAIVYFLMQGMNFQISPFLVILGGTFILLTTILPIQGVAGFGTTESVWTLAFVPLGLSAEQAIVSGFCYHIIVIFYFMILGAYGWLKLRE